MSQPKAPPQLLDLGDRAFYLRGTAPEKLWIMVFLLAVRDSQQRVVLRAEGNVVRFWVEDENGPHDLASPAPILVPKLHEIIWRLGLPVKKGVLEMFGVDEIIKLKELPEAWTASFRLKLNHGLKAAKATATTEGTTRLLIVELADVSIPGEDAGERLRELMALRDAAKDSKK